MSLPRPFEAWREHVTVQLPGASAVFTTRRGGVSAGPYAALNLGRMTGDGPAAVARNRELLAEAVGRPLAGVRQVHSGAVKRLERLPRPGDRPEAADGQVTIRAGIAPLVLVADCLPVAVAGGGAVAILHAGWRGLAEGILAEGVRAVRELGSGGRLEAAIGPGAGPCCYEVGEEVHARFTDYGPGVRRGRNLDLKAIARAQLERFGVTQTYDLEACTICGDPALWFSHRRDGGLTGRQAGLVWLS